MKVKFKLLYCVLALAVVVESISCLFTSEFILVITSWFSTLGVLVLYTIEKKVYNLGRFKKIGYCRILTVVSFAITSLFLSTAEFHYIFPDQQSFYKTILLLYLFYCV